MTNRDEVLRRWKALAGDTSARPWEPEDTAGFFQLFRPSGDGLEAAFEGIEAADEILPRLLEVYEATAEGWDEDPYFIVSKPRPIPASRAKDLLGSHLERVAAMARAVGDDELMRLLARPLRLEVGWGETPWPPGDDDPETTIYEATGDFMRSLTPRESHALLMEEGLYTLACDYNLRHHILWPLYRHASGIDEPFGPYFELWKHGAGYRFTGEREVTVFVP
jgi:hypothetical protein